MKTYRTVIADAADADLDRIYLRLLRTSMNAATEWQTGFEAARDSLNQLPHRCPPARDGGRFRGIVVRQLYFGKYRLVFHVVEAADDEEEGTVTILRVLYGAQSMTEASQTDDEQ